MPEIKHVAAEQQTLGTTDSGDMSLTEAADARKISARNAIGAFLVAAGLAGGAVTVEACSGGVATCSDGQPCNDAGQADAADADANAADSGTTADTGATVTDTGVDGGMVTGDSGVQPSPLDSGTLPPGLAFVAPQFGISTKIGTGNSDQQLKDCISDPSKCYSPFDPWKLRTNMPKPLAIKAETKDGLTVVAFSVRNVNGENPAVDCPGTLQTEWNWGDKGQLEQEVYPGKFVSYVDTLSVLEQGIRNMRDCIKNRPAPCPKFIFGASGTNVTYMDKRVIKPFQWDYVFIPVFPGPN